MFLSEWSFQEHKIAQHSFRLQSIYGHLQCLDSHWTASPSGPCLFLQPLFSHNTLSSQWSELLAILECTTRPIICGAWPCTTYPIIRFAIIGEDHCVFSSQQPLPSFQSNPWLSSFSYLLQNSALVPHVLTAVISLLILHYHPLIYESAIPVEGTY